MSKVILSLILVIVVAVGAAIGGIIIGKTYFRDKKEVTSMVSVDGVKKISELVAVEYYLSSCEKTSDYAGSDWIKLFPREYFILIKGTVLGGVDLDKALIDINHENKQVVINLQEGSIRIHAPEIDPGDIKLKSCKDNIFDPVKLEDVQSAIEFAQKNLIKTAENNGIKDKTINEARVLIASYLQSLGYTAKVVLNDT